MVIAPEDEVIRDWVSKAQYRAKHNMGKPMKVGKMYDIKFRLIGGHLDGPYDLIFVDVMCM